MELPNLAQNPFSQFQEWFREAQDSGLQFPNAMSLATVSADGRPSLRIVLLKGTTSQGFNFFTNYASHKGRELEANPQAALCFYWDQIGKQVRIEGRVERVTHEESEIYFHSRPRLSQLGAWASAQSEEIPSRAYLEARVAEMEERFAGQEIPLPEFWGGYLLRPDYFEFWQLRVGRLHDRLAYKPNGAEWAVHRLSP